MAPAAAISSRSAAPSLCNRKWQYASTLSSTRQAQVIPHGRGHLRTEVHQNFILNDFDSPFTWHCHSSSPELR